MPGGSYSALSGMRMRLEELDRLAADLANVNTVGYKTERSSTYAFAAAPGSAVNALNRAVSAGRDRYRRPFPRRYPKLPG